MIRMIQLSLIALRIAQRGRSSAANFNANFNFNSAFVGVRAGAGPGSGAGPHFQFQKNAALGRTRITSTSRSSSSAIFLEAKNLKEEDDNNSNGNGNSNGKSARNISTGAGDRAGAGTTGNIRTPSGRRYQSRLASIYDEMFADDNDDDDDVDNNDSSDSRQQQQQHQPLQRQQQQQPPRKANNDNNDDNDGYQNFNPKPKNVDFDLDDDYPQDFHVDFNSNSSSNSRIGQQQPPRRKPSQNQRRQSPAQAQPQSQVQAPRASARLPQRNDPPPRAQASTSTTSITTDTSSSSSSISSTSNNTYESSSSSSYSSAKLAPKDITPPRAQAQAQQSQSQSQTKTMMMRGRRMPPPVMEYDYSHYDEEFGARKAGEGTNIEFHDGMLEDIDGDGDDDNDGGSDDIDDNMTPSLGLQSISGSITQSQSNSNGNGMLETITNEEEKIEKDYSSTIEKNSIEFELPEETSSLEQQTKTYEYTEEIITSETTKISMDGKVEVDADERMPTTSESIDTTSGPHYSGQVKDEPEPSRDTDTKESWRNSFARQSQMRMPSRPTANGAGVGTGAGTNTSKPVKVEVAYSAPTGGADPNSLSMLESQLEQFQTEMFALNDGKEFNIKSPKQVSVVLFGVDNESTNKDALDAIAGNVSDHTKSRLASLVLKYRKTLSQIKRVQKTKENKANGTHTTPLNSMKKGNGRLDGTAAVTAMESNKPDANEKTAIGQVVVSPMNASTTDEEPLVLVDASAYIFRAYYSMPPMHRDDGEPIGATLGFCNMLNKLVLTPLLQGKRPRIILVFDSKSGTNFRKKIYPEYKANRSACPEDLIPQFDFVRDAADAYGILQLEAPGFEADDVVATIGTMAVKEGCYVNILSGDKDLMQLVTKSENGGPCIEMIDPMKMVRFCHDTVKEKWGVEPSLLGDILALAGDSADNIPGVPGIGPKIAASLIQEYGSLDGLLENVEQVKQKGRQKNLKDNAHLARLSRELVELDRNISLEDMSFPTHYQNISDIRMESFDKDRLIKFYETMGLHELKRRVTSRLPKKRNGRAPSGFDRYASITEQLPEQHFRSFKSVKTEENDQGFSTPSTFKKPPTPEDFSDVPF